MIPLKDNVPTARFPVVTVLLIVVNLGFFIWQLGFSGSEATSPQLAQLGVTERDENSVEYGAIPYRILHPGRDCAFGVADGGTQAEVVCQGTKQYAEARIAEQEGLGKTEEGPGAIRAEVGT